VPWQLPSHTSPSLPSSAAASASCRYHRFTNPRVLPSPALRCAGSGPAAAPLPARFEPAASLSCLFAGGRALPASSRRPCPIRLALGRRRPCGPVLLLRGVLHDLFPILLPEELDAASIPSIGAEETCEREFNYFGVMFTEERGRVVLLSAGEFSDIQLQSYKIRLVLTFNYSTTELPSCDCACIHAIPGGCNSPQPPAMP
jgi:hypothetical protein